jgi:hypothetical protein
MSDLTFPQVGDLPDSAFFSSLVARGRSGIVSGLTLNADFAVPEVTVQPGFAVIASGSETTQHPNISPAETVQETSKVVDLDAQTVALTDNAVNSIFVDVNTGVDDAPQVIVNTTGTSPTPASLKIGEVDTSSNTTAEQFNKIEEDGTRSFPTSAAASDALAGLPSGVSVIDRSRGLRLSANGELSSQGVEPLIEATANNDSVVILSLTGFDSYIIRLSNVQPAAGAVDLRVDFSPDGGSTTLFPYEQSVSQFDGGTISGSSSGSAGSGTLGTTISGRTSFNINLEEINSNNRPRLNAIGETGERSFIASVELKQSTAVNAVRFFFSGSDIAAGTFRVFGVN